LLFWWAHSGYVSVYSISSVMVLMGAIIGFIFSTRNTLDKSK
jgi:hypothetical protein